MIDRRIRLVVIGALGVGLALSQQACAGSLPTEVAAPGPSGVASSSIPTEPPLDEDAGSGGSSEDGACRNDDLEVTVTLQPSRDDDAHRGLVAVTNKGDEPCRLEGRASISLTNAAGEAVDVPTKEVHEPGAAVPITLKPGTSAFQGIKWTSCDKGSATCPAGNGLRFSVQSSTDGPAAELDGFPAPEKSNLTMKSLRVGTLQPIAQGVVAW
ncbi:DUF4232 domain-containing protein [Actinoplanes sp. NBRC 103695]|uniref:DUF4232 domain-containing protein n=1 Tax=Actinoplanes sp. NBRC 103695 TaxID=3032202 RepID=UPI002552A871|nr:DUF4232 domain-containing protein [Actinoplanes sp. NBRC 103695]